MKKRPIDPNKLIKDRGVVSVETNFEPQGTMDALAIRNYYRKLLGPKRLKDDPVLLEFIIDARMKMRHRYSARIMLYSTEKEGPQIVAELFVSNCLIEEGQTMVNYWHDKTVDTSSFNNQVEGFKNAISGNWTKRCKHHLFSKNKKH